MKVSEYQIRIAIAILAFIVGVFVGYTLWHRARDSKTLTALQIVSIGVFFLYLILTAFGNVQYSDLVAVSILALTGGEPVGKALAKFAEKSNKDGDKGTDNETMA